MLIQGSLSADKSDFLLEKYVKLLNSGVSASKILVLVQNSTLKQNFINAVLERLEIDSFEKLRVHSFFSLVYNSVSDNWAVLENVNPDKNRSVILPNLVGLEVSQFILKNIIKDVKFRGYNSRKSLLHQIFRRYSLIVQNNLSKDEVEERAKILKEPFKEDIDLTLKLFLQKTLKLRSFDYLRQCLVFNYIYKNTDYFKEIEYLLLDDGDEITPVCFDFIEHLAPQLKEWYICYDFKGSSRVGYLSADKPAVWEFERLFKEKTVELEPQGKMYSTAEKIFDNVLYDKQNTLTNFSLQSPSKRSGMIDLAVREIKSLLDSGVLPCEISLVTPCVDEMLKFTLIEKLARRVNLKPLSGSEKLIQNRLVLSVLNILKLNTSLVAGLSEFNLRPVFNDFLNIPLKYCDKILQAFEEEKRLIDFEFPNPEHTEKYRAFLEFLNGQDCKKLSQQAFEVFDKFAFLSACTREEIGKFNFFLKELKDFEDVFADEIAGHEAEILLQIENSIISENPYSTLEVAENDLILSTPQKIIDNQIRTKYQFWLDVSSQEWVKSDIGPLYNAWVYQKGWEKETFTVEDNLQLSRDKTARILRKLTLLAGERVSAYSSLFDGNGLENFGGIEDYIKVAHTESTKSGGFRITPREDQKPVLDYRSGRMAISAVPGAGKTTILLALIVKLLEAKVPAENIFVMTYMESAARNFRDRIKNIFPDSAQLPNISTIHGLALRILKENNNFERLGLSGDFEICDDTVRGRLIRQIAAKTGVAEDELADFDRAVSIFKFSQVENPQSTDAKINKFLRFFAVYRQALLSRNLIDYDDILLYSVQLLERFEDVREYYQNICHFIIEDEAQDSSSLQQRLINLLSAKHGNLIRCGDINQAITTTFSNADVEGFWKFIEESRNVSMDCSQRCTKDVWTLANNLISWSETKEFLKGSFYPMFMRPVEGRNPVSKNAVEAKVFPAPKEEKDFIVKEIRDIIKHDPKATIGILLRSNYQVNLWASHIESCGLKTITRTECLAQKLIFRVIFALLKVVLTPFDNETCANAYEILSELGAFKLKNTNYIREAKIPFVQFNPDEITDVEFSRFYWEILYWISQTSLTPEELAMKIGLYYFNTEIEKSNVYLIATLVKRLSLNTQGGLKGIVAQLEELSRKNRVSGFNFFSQEDENDKGFFEGKIQIMTMHKSKGDEFDYVFIPELTERNLTFEVSELKLKPSDIFNENLRRLSPAYRPKSQKDMMKQILTENLKLLYVAITRARKHLYISTYEKQRPNDKYTKVNIIFRELLGVREE